MVSIQGKAVNVINIELLYVHFLFTYDYETCSVTNKGNKKKRNKWVITLHHELNVNG